MMVFMDKSFKIGQSFSIYINWILLTYADLHGIPIEIVEHRIVLEEDAKPIWQRQHGLNPKYSLMVKEELDKLLHVAFIYATRTVNGFLQYLWCPRRMEKLEFVKIIGN